MKELEIQFNGLPLDIEFGLTKKNKLYLFQARPVITKNNFFLKNEEFDKKNFSKF